MLIAGHAYYLVGQGVRCVPTQPELPGNYLASICFTPYL